MPWLLRHHRYRRHVREIDLATDAPRSFLTFMRANRLLFVAGLVGGLALSDLPAADSAPETPKKPVATNYQGVTVEDPFQWLEEDNEPQVKAWSAAQNQRTRQYLDKLPDRAAIEKQLTE